MQMTDQLFTLATEVRHAESWGEFFLELFVRLLPLIVLIGLLWIIIAWAVRRNRPQQSRIMAHIDTTEAHMWEEARLLKRAVFLLEKMAGVESDAMPEDDSREPPVAPPPL